MLGFCYHQLGLNIIDDKFSTIYISEEYRVDVLYIVRDLLATGLMYLNNGGENRSVRYHHQQLWSGWGLTKIGL